MNERRSFLKATLFLAGAAVFNRPARAEAAAVMPSGIVYTEASPGKWEGKAGSHAPQVSVDGMKVGVATKHPMSEKHFIVRHTLVAADGTVVGAKTFFPTDAEAASSFEVPAAGTYYATSFCNIHDFWVTEFTI
jgi:superoxide reductase